MRKNYILILVGTFFCVLATLDLNAGGLFFTDQADTVRNSRPKITDTFISRLMRCSESGWSRSDAIPSNASTSAGGTTMNTHKARNKLSKSMFTCRPWTES